MPLNPHDFELLRGIIADRTGNVVSPEQEYLLNSRLEALTREQGLVTLGDLITALRRAPQSLLHDKVAEAMTINETSFFRDGDLFNGLKKHAIPRFIEENRMSRSLSIWSAFRQIERKRVRRQETYQRAFGKIWTRCSMSV